MAKPNKNNRLGRGLSALLKDEPTVKTAQDEGAKKLVGNILEVELEKITANPWQPRTNFDKKSLEELVSSISTLGVIQPITVRKKDSGEYELISGERRFRASQLAGKKSIPAYVRLANDQEMLEMALVENIQRQDLDAIEIALSYQQLIDEIKLTQEELSKRVGKDRTSITNYLRLLKLDPIIQTGIRYGFISMGHGRALISIENLDIQSDIYHKIVMENLSVRETEALVKNHQDSLKPAPAKSKKTSGFVIDENQKNAITNFFGTKIDLKVAGNGKGKITIPFHSEEDLNRIIKLLKG